MCLLSKATWNPPEVPRPSGGEIFTEDCDVPRCCIYERRHQEGQATHRARTGRTYPTRCGQRYLDSDLDIESVSVLMGHASTKTTESFYSRKKLTKAVESAKRTWKDCG